MQISDYVNTFGRDTRARLGFKVHKLTIHAGFTCPTIDGSKGRGGCSFCNNASFAPNSKQAPDVVQQIQSGQAVVQKRTGARKYLAYFQAYTNTYDDIDRLDALYRSALDQPDVVGLSVGTRPDCVPDAVLALLASYRDEGYEVWLELGLQSAFDDSLQRVNRGHGFAEYVDAVTRARPYKLPICTHLIIGLPGESARQSLISLERVLEHGVAGLKLHPLHVVRNTLLAHQWRKGEYQPLTEQDYVETAAALVQHTPADVVYHRLTATAQNGLLLAPQWCDRKWPVINAISEILAVGGGQGSRV